MTPRDALVRLRLAEVDGDVPCVATAAMQSEDGVTVLPVGPDTSGHAITLRGREVLRLSLGAAEVSP